jgi:DNA-binding transcriptional MerR regulator
VDQVGLPNKLYFRIGEVAKIIGVKPYVLRYWETEFTILKPGKTPSRHRLYRRRDVETLLEIKRLLYQEGFTIAGAKKRLKDLEREEPALPEPSPAPQNENYRQILQDLRKDLYALYQLLNGKSSRS